MTSHIFSPILFCVYLLMFCDVTYIFTYTFLCLFYMCFMTSSAYVFVTSPIFSLTYVFVTSPIFSPILFCVYLLMFCDVTYIFTYIFLCFFAYVFVTPFYCIFPLFYCIFPLFYPFFVILFTSAFPISSYFLSKRPHKRDSENPFI